MLPVSPPSGDPLITQLYFEHDPRSAGISDDLVIPVDMTGVWTGEWDIVLDVDGSIDVGDPHGLPSVAKLHQNYPNPFNPRTTIRYQLRLESPVTLDVFTPGGQVVRRLVSEPQGPGFYTVTWDGRDDAGRAAASGVYLYRLRARGADEVRKMMLAR